VHLVYASEVDSRLQIVFKEHLKVFRNKFYHHIATHIHV
jgi:hypothetical protein